MPDGPIGVLRPLAADRRLECYLSKEPPRFEQQPHNELSAPASWSGHA